MNDATAFVDGVIGLLECLNTHTLRGRERERDKSKLPRESNEDESAQK